MVTVSIVSHGHGSMVARLVESLLLFSEVSEVIVTRNIPEAIDLPDDDRVVIIDNLSPNRPLKNGAADMLMV